MRAMFTVLILVACAFSQARAETRVINADAHYPEGPVWYRGKLYYIEYDRNTVVTWDGKQNQVFAQMPGCGPSAVIPTNRGEFLVACADSSRIGRLRADGTSLPAYTHDKDGNALVGPNDFAADSRGGIYFSASGNNTAFNDPTAHPDTPIVDGKVFYIAADETITQVATEVHGANGLAVSKNGRTLFLAETDERRLQKFTISGDGKTLSDQRTFVDLDELTGHVGHIWPDGVKIDSKGAIYIGQSPRETTAPLVGVIFIIDGNAKLLRTLKLPSIGVPNLAFGPSEATVYVTAIDQIDKSPYHGKVYSISNRGPE